MGPKKWAGTGWDAAGQVAGESLGENLSESFLKPCFTVSKPSQA